MSSRNVANEILSLVVLVNASLPLESDRRVSVSDVRHFIAGCEAGVGEAAAELVFPVSQDECAVVVCIEQFNADDTDPVRPALLTIGSEGVAQTRAEVSARWGIGSDVFYVFGPGKATLTFKASPEAGSTLFARALGYYLPVRVLDRLSRIGTRVISV